VALAILRFENEADGQARFDVDLGHNRWYVYAIGEGTTERVHGMELLADPGLTSELMGPLPPQARGRTTLQVPSDAFTKEMRCMQLMSFGTQERRGPAVSDVVRVPLGGWRLGQAGRSVATSLGRPIPRETRGTIPFTLVEATSRGPYSTQFFWQALLGLLPTILPMVAPLLTNLFKGLMGGSNTGAVAGGTASGEGSGNAPLVGLVEQIGQILQKPEAKDVLEKLINAAQSNGAGRGSGAATGGAAVGATASESSIRSRAQFIDGGILTGPALAGLIGGVLPALLPLLQQGGAPQMVNTLLTGLSPERTMGGLGDLLMDPLQTPFGGLFQTARPQVGPSVLPALLVRMQARVAASPVPGYRAVKGVSLALEGLLPQTVNGTSRVLFRAGRDLTLGLSLATPKPIRNAELHWQVKHPITLESLAHGMVRQERLATGELPPLTIPSAALADLAVPEDYIVCASLIWKDRQGRRIGVRQSVIITLAGEFLFDRAEDLPVLEDAPSSAADDGESVGSRAEPVPLADVQAHRDFWHKIWEGGFTDDARSRRIECKYYYALDQRRDVGRMQTIEKLVKGEHDDPVLRLRTGLMLGAEALNALLPTLIDAPALDGEHLAAIRSPDFRRRFAQAALARLTLKGRAGERAALWVYPEIKLQRIVLKRAAAVDGAGQITELAEEPVVFPMPMLAHFIATRTER
jgi:hypothetical protein